MKEEEVDVQVGFSVFNLQTNRRIYTDFAKQHARDKTYIAELEKLLSNHGIEIPPDIVPEHTVVKRNLNDRIMLDGSLNSLTKSITSIAGHNNMHEIYVQYRNLSFWNMAPERKIPTVGSTIKGIFLGSGPKRRVDILKDLSGRILPKTMTLLMGPPGCGELSSLLICVYNLFAYIKCRSVIAAGKTTFLKALACQLNVGKGHLEGEILYNGDPVDCGKYLVGKITSYVDERDQHAPTLTVRETLEFAWRMTSGGHHSYGVARDAKSAEILDRGDAQLTKVMHNDHC